MSDRKKHWAQAVIAATSISAGGAFSGCAGTRDAAPSQPQIFSDDPADLQNAKAPKTPQHKDEPKQEEPPPQKPNFPRIKTLNAGRVWAAGSDADGHTRG